MLFKKVRTRFAPSPTGMMHLGGARTALFNYLFAKHFKGDFIVRFEDTDLKRNDFSSIDQLLSDLKWLGIKPCATIGTDDQYSPYRQSQRLNIYAKYAQELLLTKKVYPCFCTPLELKKVREKQIKKGQTAPKYNRKCWSLSSQKIIELQKAKTSFCLRFFVAPKQKIIFTDLVYGKMEFISENIEDFVIIKTNNYPTYNFAVVIDDYLMQISHVWRGSDHLSNTPKQILLYQTFGWQVPMFGHLSLIQFSSETKMSKRFEIPEQHIDYYRVQGYLPETFFNYLSLLGWTPDKFQELFTQEELIKLFDGNNLNKTQSIFSLSKLNWINNKKLLQLSDEEFQKQWFIFAFLKKQKILKNWNKDDNFEYFKKNNYQLQILDHPRIVLMILFFRKEINSLEDLFLILVKYIGCIDSLLDPEYLLLNHFLFQSLDKHIDETIWDENGIQSMLKQVQKDTNLKGRNFFAPIYYLINKLKEGPAMSTLLFLFGKDEIKQRLKKYFELHKTQKNN